MWKRVKLNLALAISIRPLAKGDSSIPRPWKVNRVSHFLHSKKKISPRTMQQRRTDLYVRSKVCFEKVSGDSASSFVQQKWDATAGNWARFPLFSIQRGSTGDSSLVSRFEQEIWQVRHELSAPSGWWWWWWWTEEKGTTPSQDVAEATHSQEHASTQQRGEPKRTVYRLTALSGDLLAASRNGCVQRDSSNSCDTTKKRGKRHTSGCCVSPHIWVL